MSDLGCIEQTTSWEHQGEVIKKFIKDKVVAGRALQILEAGCGQRWTINLDEVDYCLTGVDLDKAALEMRKGIRGDLHRAVEGDLRSVELRERQYDVIYSAYVLEHVKGAEQVLNNFLRWIRSGGIIIILVPDPDSVHGFVTRHTPHWFHVVYHRLIGHRNAGKPGHAPYPVHYDGIIFRKGMHDFCSRNDVTILAEYGDGHYRPGNGPVRFFLHALKLLIGTVSSGRLSARHTNILYILEKR